MKTEEKITKIVAWIKDYATKAKIKTLVVGISGGIDSSVTSILCAMTGIPTIVVSLPIGNIKRDNLTEKHWTNLNKYYPGKCQRVNIDLTDAVNAFDNANSLISPSLVQQDLKMLAQANIQSRMRMISLYNIALISGGIVVGTGNKVEDFGVGFFTKYGDGGVDISPIADLMKSEVYELGDELGVDENILAARPTDGLWPDGRTDEDQIGATYDELEWAMKTYQHDRTREVFEDEVSKHTPRQKEVLKIYTDRHYANMHKMLPIPICKL
jgi:NAD+ synthase